jgi:rhodanese-related sulfurtransferase
MMLSRLPASRVGIRPAASLPATRLRAPSCRAEFPRWTSIVEYLEYADVQTVSADAAENLVDEGWLLVDVRPTKNKPYSVMHAAEVPIFEEVDMASLRTVPRKVAFRAVAHTINGVTPMAINEDFVEQVTAIAGDRNVVLMCEKGGSLAPSKPEPARSISAAWKLRTAWDTQGRDSQKIAHMAGGTRAWTRRTLNPDV